MAGRKPSKGRDEQAGVTPLLGSPPARSGAPLPPLPGTDEKWPRSRVTAAGPASWAGTQGHQTHGTSMSSARIKLKIDRRAREFMARVLEDPSMPDHLRSPAFRLAVWGWSKAEIMSEVVWEWACELIEGEGLTAMMLPPLPGTNPVFVTIQLAESKAAWHRSRLGVDPVSFARLAKDLGLNQRAAEDGLTRLAGEGAQIVKHRRALMAVPSDAPADADER